MKIQGYKNPQHAYGRCVAVLDSSMALRIRTLHVHDSAVLLLGLYVKESLVDQILWIKQIIREHL